MKSKKPTCGRCGWQTSGVCRKTGAPKQDQYVSKISEACSKFTETSK